jgi:hypothetical protein
MNKKFLLITFSLFVLGNPVFSQCPEGGMKFQGPLCEIPTEVGVKELSCSELVLKWKGSRDQNFIIEASYLDPSTNSEMAKVATSDIDISCSYIGECNAVISVIEGMIVSYSLQAKCKNSIYSDVIHGKDVSIPFCNELPSSISVYPNPNNGKMTVAYMGNNSGPIHFFVYDMQGRIVFDQLENAVAGVSAICQFNLTALTPGIYLLEARSGEESKWIKFVIE